MLRLYINQTPLLMKPRNLSALFLLLLLTLCPTVAGAASSANTLSINPSATDSVANDTVTDLQEIIVEGRAVVQSKGRITVTPSEQDRTGSSTSLSLLQKLPLPGLFADELNRSLSVDGGSPIILINGVPSSISELNAVLPKDIAKVEYARLTPERYADKGAKGMVSITLREREDGGTFQFWGQSAVTTAFMDYNVNTSYHQGPSQFSINYNPSWRNYARVYDHTTQEYIAPDFNVKLESHDRNPFYYYFHNVRAKYDYVPNENTSFAATFSINPFNSKRRAMGSYSDSVLGDYDYVSHQSSEDITPSLDLFFHRDFNPRNTLELQVVGTIMNSDFRRDNNYYYSDGTEQTYATAADSRRHSLISEMYYSHHFTDDMSLSGGYQNTISHSKNKYLDTGYEPKLTENNNYVYARFAWQLKKVYMSLSSGMKMFWMKNGDNKSHFIRNISSARLNWYPNDTWNFGASFQYTPSIPSLASLTDYTQQITPYLVTNGNPDLKESPCYSYSVNASYSIDKLYLSLNVLYDNTRNAMITSVKYIGDRKFLSHTVNASDADQVNPTLYARVGPFGGFNIAGQVGVLYSHFKFDGFSNHLTSLYGYLSAWWSNDRFTVQYTQAFPRRFVWGYDERRSENSSQLSFQYRPEKHWSIGVAWMCPFQPKGLQYPTKSYSPVNPSKRDRYIKNNGNMVMLSVSYDTNFGSIFRSGRRKLNNADRSSSLLK